MSGHNKWSTIKHKKGAADAKRGKIFSRISKEIIICVQRGGGDPSANPTLRTLISKGRAENMPSDNIDRAIKRGTGELESAALVEYVYEGYAPGGIAVLCECLSDNKNRTAADVKHVFNKFGGNLGAQGSVSRMFDRKGKIIIPAEGMDEDSLMEIAIEAGADDMEREDDVFVITTDPNAFSDVQEAIEAQGVTVQESEITKIPETTTPVTEKGKALSLLKFIDALEELDDVQNVFSNFDIDDAMMQEIEDES
ncbi:MAG: YebC/PmpR family DNA-binding transcriptional regulator [Spartobacteria bacterium]|nr:YebC/PmpR family DNA-binding transcriptional regulator [Spartobacteria bacterium]